MYRGPQPGGVGWAGVYWQSPANNWGTVPGPAGYDLSRASRLTFWVRGQTGAERIQFLVGGITGRYGDSLQPAVKTPVLTLSTEWQEVTIPLTGMDLTHVIGGFGWVATSQDNPSGAPSTWTTSCTRPDALPTGWTRAGPSPTCEICSCAWRSPSTRPPPRRVPADEGRSGADRGDEIRRVDSAPAVLR